MSANAEQPKSELKAKLTRILIFAGILLVAFLIGFLPMWLKARGASNQRDSVQRDSGSAGYNRLWLVLSSARGEANTRSRGRRRANSSQASTPRLTRQIQLQI
jgi:hypothetical protein